MKQRASDKDAGSTAQNDDAGDGRLTDKGARLPDTNHRDAETAKGGRSEGRGEMPR